MSVSRLVVPRKMPFENSSKAVSPMSVAPVVVSCEPPAFALYIAAHFFFAGVCMVALARFGLGLSPLNE